MSVPANIVNIRCCTDACALNNAGVSLMLQGRLEDAASALKDSLAIMGTIIRLKEQPNSLELQQFVQAKLQAASTNFSHSRIAGTVIRPPLSAVESNDVQSLRTASAMSSDTQGVPSFTAVLIREPCRTINAEGLNFERESGIMLYNFGLACYMLTGVPLLDPIKRNSFDNTAYKSLILSHSAFSRILTSCDDAADDLESVFLAVLVLSCTQRVFRARNEQSKAIEAQEAIDNMLLVVEDEYVAALIEVKGMAAAAA